MTRRRCFGVLTVVAICGLGLLLWSFGASTENGREVSTAFNIVPDESQAFERVKDLIRRRAWKDAHEVAKSFNDRDQRPNRFDPYLFEWTVLQARLRDLHQGRYGPYLHEREAAAAARMVGLFDVAMEHLQTAIERADDDSQRTDARNALAHCAGDAGAQAVVERDYDRAIRMFALMSQHHETWKKQDSQQKVQQVRKLAAAPNDVANRIEFVEQYWPEPAPTVLDSRRRARQFLTESLDLNPSKDQRRKIYVRIQELSEALGDLTLAEEYAKRLVSEFAAEPVAASATLALAQFYLRQKEYDKSEKLFLGLINDVRDDSVVPRAMLELARLYAAKGDEARQGEWLKRCAEFDDPVQKGMATDHIRSEAIQRLASWHEQRGEWAEALRWWQAWQPSSGCGTCYAGMLATRCQHVATSYQRLGDHSAAAKTYLHGLLRDGGWGWNEHLALPLFQLYDDAGQLDDLFQVVDAFEQRKVKERGAEKPEETLKHLAAQPLRFLRNVRGLVEKGDVRALIQICGSSNHCDCNTAEHEARPDWRCKAAAEALAQCDGKEIQPLRDAIANRKGTSISWYVYALGKSSSPMALDVLRELARQEMGRNCVNYAYAISLRGEPGRKLLVAIAERGQNGMQHAARERLEQVEKARPLGSAPPVKAGSLPKWKDLQW